MYIGEGKEICATCRWCSEAGQWHQSCDYYLLHGVGHRRGGTMTTCDKYEKGKHGRSSMFGFELYTSNSEKTRKRKLDSSIDAVDEDDID